MREPFLLPTPQATDQRVMLDRALSKLGVCSRFEARRFVHAGRVRVNGKVITQHTHWITLQRDRIQLDEALVDDAVAQRYFMLHKPAGYVTTRQDNLQRPTVFDLLPHEITSPPAASKHTWVFPVGRLDADSEGLLLFTNDGTLSHALTAPASHVYKTYRILLDQLPARAAIRALAHGITLRDGKTLPARIKYDVPAAEPWLEIAIREGKNRQVRRMFAEIGCEVLRLIRTSIGPLQLGDLPLGEWRELQTHEVRALQQACRLEITRDERASRRTAR